MDCFDYVIIGGGLGGLLCGSILSKEGFSVCIVEKNNKLGGSIQSFAKDKVIYNTGLNYTESLGEGEVLNRYFKYFGILDELKPKLRQMDVDGFERISFAGDPNEYPFAQGHDHFVDRLSEFFPSEQGNLVKYMSFLRQVSATFPLFSLECDQLSNDYGKYLDVGAFDYLLSVTDNPKLQNILAGMNSLYAGVKGKTPLYVHALINSSFIKSSWRIEDGSSQLAMIISRKIKANGGEVLTKTPVVGLRGKNRKIEYADLANGDRVYGRNFISNIHPSITLDLLDDPFNKPAFRRRLKSLNNTIGMFTLYANMKDQSFPYINYNHHYFRSDSVWTAEYNANVWPEHFMLYTPPNSKSTEFADGLIVITYMRFSEVARWSNTFVENRGAEYLEFKHRKAEQLFDLMETKFPGIRGKVANYYTSTPLTYRDYTSTPEGSAYGIQKDYHDPYSTIISARSRTSNLFFTGQNLNMHGILGVSIGAVVTCSEILGLGYLVDKIRKY